jgi:hypothetical protein
VTRPVGRGAVDADDPALHGHGHRVGEDRRRDRPGPQAARDDARAEAGGEHEQHPRGEAGAGRGGEAERRGRHEDGERRPARLDRQREVDADPGAEKDRKPQHEMRALGLDGRDQTGADGRDARPRATGPGPTRPVHDCVAL